MRKKVEMGTEKLWEKGREEEKERRQRSKREKGERGRER